MRTARWVLVAVAIAGTSGCLALPAMAAGRRGVPEDQVVLSGTADVPRGDTAGQIVVVHGAASIEGVAVGDVIVFSGRISVGGQVSGDVVNLDGTIVLASTAQVRGDVVSRGAVVVRKGAQVQGSVREHAPLNLQAAVDPFGPLATWLAVTVSTLLVGLALLWLAPRAGEAVLGTARRAPWASAAWGMALLVTIPVAAMALAFTLIGLPIALALALASGLALFAGYAWTGWILGRMLLPPPRSRLLALLAGLGIVRVVGAIPVIGGVTWIVGGGFGLGAVAVAVWSARGVGGKHRAGRAERFGEPADLDVPSAERRSDGEVRESAKTGAPVDAQEPPLEPIGDGDAGRETAAIDANAPADANPPADATPPSTTEALEASSPADSR
jgi:cytoskeletal protein CcmA (bactofilin family)